jgi:hypothetical protein
MMKINRERSAGAGGFVFLPVLALGLTLVFLAAVLSDTSSNVVSRVEHRVEQTRLEAAADVAIDLVMQDLWNSYKASLGSQDNTVTRFRNFLDGRGVHKRALSADATEEFDIFGHVPEDAPEWKDVLSLSALTTDAKGRKTVDGLVVHSLSILRQDAQGVSALRARAVVSTGGDLGSRNDVSFERLYFAGGERFRGFDFALLANNVNCIMCHATVDSADRYYNKNPALRGTFGRIRIGTMESLKIRAGKADSHIAGAIYTRGPVMDKDGTLLPDLDGSDLWSAAFDGEGQLAEDGSGTLDPTVFVDAVGDPLPEMQNLYMNYPRDADKQTDGAFPEEFPAVIPDANFNRRVDAAEYAELADLARGTLAGGKKIVVPAGSTYAPAGLPVFDSAGALEGAIPGNLVAYGTASNPIVIDGRITVNGDVVIGGVVRGAGEIIARSNAYVVGSLTYADGGGAGNRTFGVASDGTENRLTLAAGGNLLVGDFLRDKSGKPVSGESTGEFNFTISEVTLFNQMEWVRTQTKVLTESGDAYVTNPTYDPTHVPRYYVVRPGNPVAIFNKVDTYFNVDTLTWLGKEHLGNWKDELLTYYPVGSPEHGAAVVLSLMPTDPWIDDSQLITMWDAMEADHPGGPFLLDAFLYTNNSIGLMVRKTSPYGGEVLINGGLVGADLGILVAGGLRLNYDARHKEVIKLFETKKGEVELQRGVRLR